MPYSSHQFKTLSSSKVAFSRNFMIDRWRLNHALNKDVHEAMRRKRLITAQRVWFEMIFRVQEEWDANRAQIALHSAYFLCYAIIGSLVRMG